MKKVLILSLVVAVALLFVLTVTAAPTAVGAEKCKMCHKVQYDSWAASKHAAAKLDCEGCHGPGSDYMKMSVMKDPAAAKAAGLIVPDKAACAKCHGKDKVPAMTDDMFKKVHAHKAK
jgi:hypothetical protein